MCPLLTASLQRVAELPPRLDRFGGELFASEGVETSGRTGNESDGTTQHHSGRSDLAPGRASFMIAIGAKKLLQIIIGAGEVGDAIAVKQTRPVAAADFQEVRHRRREGPGFGLMPSHGPEQPLQTSLHGCRSALFFIAEEVGHTLHPAIGHAHIWPQRRCSGQAPLEDGFQAPEFLGQYPLFSTRSRLSAMALSRSCSWRPEAAKG